MGNSFACPLRCSLLLSCPSYAMITPLRETHWNNGRLREYTHSIIHARKNNRMTKPFIILLDWKATSSSATRFLSPWDLSDEIQPGARKSKQLSRGARCDNSLYVDDSCLTRLQSVIAMSCGHGSCKQSAGTQEERWMCS